MLNARANYNTMDNSFMHNDQTPIAAIYHRSLLIMILACVINITIMYYN